MNDFESEIASCDGRISNCYTEINDCETRIKTLENDIAELKQLKGKFEDVDSALETANNDTSSRIGNMPSSVINPLAILKVSFFSGFLEFLKGPESQKAKSGTGNAISKIEKKIRENEEEIQNLRDKIKRCGADITSLQEQKESMQLRESALKAAGVAEAVSRQ